jgi:hypothetical protein
MPTAQSLCAVLKRRRSSSPRRSAPSSNGTISISTDRWPPIIGAQFFSAYPEATRNIFALLAFAAGFLVRPFGALVFGRLGDLVGRKYTFLVTILIMGLSTFLVGLLPGYATIGIAAPIILIALRLLQGLALGGEYGGAATYVAEHAPDGKRGYLHLVDPDHGDARPVPVAAGHPRPASMIGEEDFAAWGWRIPFLLDRPARRLGLDPSEDERIADLQEDEGRGQGLQGAADRSLRPVEERQDRAPRAVRRSSPARPWSGIPASSTRCSSCRTS